MPTFRTIDDTEVAVDAPLTQQLMQALKDNLTAVIEDDSTAPSIKRSAISDAIADQKPATAGDISIGAWRILNKTEESTALNIGESAQFIVAVGGNYRLSVRCQVTTDSATNTTISTLKRIRGGTTTDRVTHTGAGVSTVDEEVQSGDIFFVECNPQSNSGTGNFITTQGDLGVSAETAAFYNRLGGASVSGTAIITGQNAEVRDPDSV